MQELSPGEVAGVGGIIAAPASGGSSRGGILGELGFRAAQPEDIGGPQRGLDRVVDLVTGTASACPELRPPASWNQRELAVAVAFVVDTNGLVDRPTLRVVQSPGGPQSEREYHSHIFVVAAAVRRERGQLDPVQYDSAITHQVATHAAGLVFRPALKDGRAVRASVLISCQTSRAY